MQVEKDWARIVTQVKANITNQHLFTAEDKIIIAVSAGVDSQVLLAVMAQIHPRTKIIVVHIDHQLRPESSMEADFVAKQAKKYGVKYIGIKWMHVLHPVNGIEAAAREFRYTQLAQIAKKFTASKILTAHHANDLTETFMMKLIRGGRWQQLSGIKWQRHINADLMLVRPMLNIRKERLIVGAKATQIKWYEDASNADDEYLRNRIRHYFVPKMLHENQHAIEHVNQYATQINQLENMVQIQVEIYLRQVKVSNDWRQIPNEWLGETLKAYLKQEIPTIGIKDSQITQIINLFNNPNRASGYVELTQDWWCFKDYHNLFVTNKNISKLKSERAKKDSMVTLNEWHLLPNGGKFIVKQKGNLGHDLSLGEIIPLELTEAKLPLQLRMRQVGDEIKLKNGHQKIKKMMIDAKIPIKNRNLVPILVNNDDEIMWVVGYKHAWVDAEAINYEILYIPKNKQENLLNDDE